MDEIILTILYIRHIFFSISEKMIKLFDELTLKHVTKNWSGEKQWFLHFQLTLIIGLAIH